MSDVLTCCVHCSHALAFGWLFSFCLSHNKPALATGQRQLAEQNGVIHVYESPWMDGGRDKHMPSVKQDCRIRIGTLQCRAHDAGCDRRKTGRRHVFRSHILAREGVPVVLAGKRKLVCCPSGLYAMTDGCCRCLFYLETGSESASTSCSNHVIIASLN